RRGAADMTRPRSSRPSPRQPRRPARLRRPPPRKAVSAGGVVFRRGEDGIEIVLVGRTAENLWALPKGTPDEGESIEETALREVREETGLEVRIVEPLGEIRYRFGDRDGRMVDKVVYHFLMEPVGGDVALHD